MNEKDRKRLRELASKHVELANSDKNIERTTLWKKHNMCLGERPTIHIELATFKNEVVTPMLECEDEFARSLENDLICDFVNLELFDDDKVVPPYFQISHDLKFTLFGHNINHTIIKKEDGTELGHNIEHIIDDLEDDFDKITSPTIYGVDTANTYKKIEMIEDVIGDILPTKLVSHCLYATPTQHVVHMMGMENMLYALYDYPELFKEMMDRIANDYIAFFKYLEAENLLLQNHSYETLTQGSLCFYDEPEKHYQIKTTDMWGYLDSQETVGMSPEMFHEFIFPCYKRIADLYGRLSYGCCEPVSAFWDDIKTLNNLKKISVSPWCDEEFMAEQLKNSGIIYLRKPNPNYLGVGKTLDEPSFREHIEKTLKTAKGCNLEIAQRDVYTINHDIGKVKRYVEIIRESIENIW